MPDVIYSTVCFCKYVLYSSFNSGDSEFSREVRSLFFFLSSCRICSSGPSGPTTLTGWQGKGGERRDVTFNYAQLFFLHDDGFFGVFSRWRCAATMVMVPMNRLVVYSRRTGMRSRFLPCAGTISQTKHTSLTCIYIPWAFSNIHQNQRGTFCFHLFLLYPSLEGRKRGKRRPGAIIRRDVPN